MNTYYVFQNKTKEYESVGEYLWCPQKDRRGGNNLGYSNVNKVRKGDVIFHGANQETYAISIAKKDSYTSQQPRGNKIADKEVDWDDEGYRVDSKYTILKSPLNMKDHRDWFADHHEKESAFTISGKGKQMYLSKLAESHAKYILEKLLKLSQDDETKKLIENIMENL